MDEELLKRMPPMLPIDRDAFVTNVAMHVSCWELPAFTDERVLAFDAIRLESGRVVGSWKEEYARNVAHEPHRYICWMHKPQIPSRAVELVP